MKCSNLDECFRNIEEYCKHPANGIPLLVNTENDRDLQQIISRMKADPNKICYFVSSTCKEVSFPQLDVLNKEIQQNGEERSLVLIGLAPYAMLRGEEDALHLLQKWLNCSPRGYLIILLSHMGNLLHRCMGRDPRLPLRVIFLEGDVSPLPRIHLFPVSYDGGNQNMLCHVKGLLSALESYDPTKGIIDFYVKTDVKKENLPHSMYFLSDYEGGYKEFCKRNCQMAMQLQESWGSEEEWKRFAADWQSYRSWSKVSEVYFGVTEKYSTVWSLIQSGNDSYKKWLLWLFIKARGAEENPYLNFVKDHSQNWKDLEEHIYLDIAQIDAKDERFSSFFSARRYLLKDAPCKASWEMAFQNGLKQKGRDAIYYLSDESMWEIVHLFACLQDYSYTQEEVLAVLKAHFPELSAYMKTFVVTLDHIHRKDTPEMVALRNDLTTYFDQYKWQKLENHLDPTFRDWVEKLATKRVYNQLDERSLLMKRVDRNRSTVFFVDALGVEYLSYIQEKCKEQGLRCHIHICHGELPSITSMNKGFVHKDTKCIKELDELKHHNQTYDYEKQKLPIHLVAELQVIDHLLQDIKDKLLTKEIKEAVVVSDHGATRLAVLSEEENGATFVDGENKGQHGGRCCLVSENPHLPYAAYENGYAVLANYSRFKGSRKADVEVHGGATLEEVLVPLIRISLQPEDMTVRFWNDVVTFKMSETPALEVVTNFNMEKPRLLINGKFYEGILDAHKQRAKFVLVGMKRSRKYTADIYDGAECLKEQVPFELKRSVAKDRFDNLDI